MNELWERALEVLAAEYERAGSRAFAESLRSSSPDDIRDGDVLRAISAISSALASGQQKAAPEDVRRDAERYRWLRNFHVDSYLVVGKLNHLDAAIDAAMLAQVAHPDAQL